MFGLTSKQVVMLGVLISGTFITILNQTLVTPALPAIMAEMSVDASTVQWLTTGFTLVSAIMIPITAFLIDRFNMRRLFLFSMVVFTVGTALVGWGPNFPVMLAGRMIQAMGAGVLMPLVSTVMLLTFPVERRGAAMGVFGIIIMFAPALGPTIAGIVIDNADYHIMFMAVAVLSVVAIAVAASVLPGKGRLIPPNVTLDKLSVVLSTVGFGGMLYGFSVIGSTGFTPEAGVAVAVGTVVVVIFFFRQLKLDTPMLNVRVLRNRKFLVSVIIGMVLQAAIMANAVLIPVYIQTLCGYSATTSGLVLLPGSILMGVMGPIAGRMFDRRGPRAMAITGTVLLAVFTFAMTRLSTSTSIIFLGIIIAVRCFSMSLVNMPINTWGMNSLDNKNIAHGNAVTNTLRQVAGALGTALVISVYSIASSMAEPTMGYIEGHMFGMNFSFAVQAVLCTAAAIVTILCVKEKKGDAEAKDPDNLQRATLESIMHRDVYWIPTSASVADAVLVFNEKGVSAVPLLDENRRLCGIVSDGDVVRALSRQNNYDPLVAMFHTPEEDPDFFVKVDSVMEAPVTQIATPSVISVDVHDSLPEVCRILGEHRLKKVPVTDNGKVVGVVNRSDITILIMNTYVARRVAEEHAKSLVN